VPIPVPPARAVVPEPAAGAPDPFDFSGGAPANPRRLRTPTLLLIGVAAVVVGTFLFVGIMKRVQHARQPEPGTEVPNPPPPTPPAPPAWFKLTDQVVERLRSEAVPEAVLSRLTPLKDKELRQDDFERELTRILRPDEKQQFLNRILNQAANPLPKGFVALFNGTDLGGWKPPVEGRSDAWSVVNGALVGTPKPNFLPQALLTERDFADFELRFEYRWMTPGGYTIVLLRASDDKEKYGKGLAISLIDDESFQAVHGHEAGDGFRTGVVLNLTIKPPTANKPRGEWNSLRVLARRHVIEVELNGTKMPTANLDDKLELLRTHPEYSRAKGPIGLLCYYGTIEYRAVIIRPLAE
jgi:hypothetical protein